MLYGVERSSCIGISKFPSPDQGCGYLDSLAGDICVSGLRTYSISGSIANHLSFEQVGGDSREETNELGLGELVLDLSSLSERCRVIV